MYIYDLAVSTTTRAPKSTGRRGDPQWAKPERTSASASRDHGRVRSRPALRDDLPAPTPTPNEVLVRVHASSATPADNSIAAGLLKQMGVEYDFPVILGRDYFGVVEDLSA